MIFLKPKFWDKNRISLFAIMLFPISLIYIFLNFIKNFFIQSEKFSVPIICVGNIYLGGTGKTPLSIEIYSILKNLNMNPAFIRKKYEDFEDEILLQKKFGSIYQNKKRAEAIKNAIQDKFDVLVLDDGFQDLSIKKNFSIVCFNEKQGFGNGFVIPAGPLRENLSALKRVDCIVINGEKNINIENKIYNKNKEIKIFYTKYKPKNIEDFKNKKIIAFAGIGNPVNFFNLLTKQNINVIQKINFPDHYNYSKIDLDKLINKSEENNAILLTTEKDYLRINQDYKKKINYLKIDTEIENKNKFIEEIKKII